MVKKGIFMSPSWIALSYSHSQKDINFTLETLDIVCKEINKKVSNEDYKQLIEGKMPTTVWNMRINSTKKQHVK